MTDFSPTSSTPVGAPEGAGRSIGASFLSGLLMAGVAFTAFAIWVVSNGMSHSGLGDWWLLYCSGAACFLSAALFLIGGVRAARLRKSRRAFIWLAVTAYVFTTVAALFGSWLVFHRVLWSL